MRCLIGLRLVARGSNGAAIRVLVAMGSCAARPRSGAFEWGAGAVGILGADRGGPPSLLPCLDAWPHSFFDGRYGFLDGVLGDCSTAAFSAICMPAVHSI